MKPPCTKNNLWFEQKYWWYGLLIYISSTQSNTFYLAYKNEPKHSVFRCRKVDRTAKGVFCAATYRRHKYKEDIWLKPRRTYLFSLLFSEMMKGPDSNPVKLFPELFGVQYNLLNLLSYFFLCFCGLTLELHLAIRKTSNYPCQLSPIYPHYFTNDNPICNSRNMQYEVNIYNQTSHIVGFTVYLKPPKAFHDMNVEELLCRASMSPRIRGHPFHLVPKVAFMFLATNQTSNVKQLVQTPN